MTTTGILTKDFEIFSAAQFLESVSESNNSNLYLVIGKQSPWANESNPDIVQTTEYYINNLWENMIGGVRITGSDIRHVIPRNNWTANTVYDQWDHTQTNNFAEANANFYILTTDWNVYKCVYNGNSANSTIEPSVISTELISTEDGYIWKYMYSVNSYEQTRFANSDYIPVRTLIDDNGSTQYDVQDAALNGSISAIKLNNAGENYTDSNNITVTITGDGIGAVAAAAVNTISNTISSIEILNPGSGYSNARVTITTTDSGVNASANVLLARQGGHGSDPLYELGGKWLMINVRLSPEQHSLLSSNAVFRQVAIIKDPLVYGSNTISTNTTISQTVDVTVSGAAGDYVQGEYVYQGTSVTNSTYLGYVSEWDSGNNKMKLTNTIGSITNDTIIGNTSTITSFVSSVSNPSLEPRTGRILYINNIESIPRDEDQTEEFKIILEF